LVEGGLCRLATLSQFETFTLDEYRSGTSLKAQNQNGNRRRIHGPDAQAENQIYSSNDINLRPKQLEVAHHLLIAMELAQMSTELRELVGRFKY
jgi:hypothetical protein